MLTAPRHLLRSHGFHAIVYGIIAVFIASLLGVDVFARALRLRLVRLGRLAWRTAKVQANAAARSYSRVRVSKRPAVRPVDLTLAGAARSGSDVSLSADIALRPIAAAHTAADLSLSVDSAPPPRAIAA